MTPVFGHLNFLTSVLLNAEQRQATHVHYASKNGNKQTPTILMGFSISVNGNPKKINGFPKWCLSFVNGFISLKKKKGNNVIYLKSGDKNKQLIFFETLEHI